MRNGARQTPKAPNTVQRNNAEVAALVDRMQRGLQLKDLRSSEIMTLYEVLVLLHGGVAAIDSRPKSASCSRRRSTMSRSSTPRLPRCSSPTGFAACTAWLTF